MATTKTKATENNVSDFIKSWAKEKRHDDSFKLILPEASKSGLEYYYIEQGGNFAKDPIQSVTDSAAFFKKNLEKYLK